MDRQILFRGKRADKFKPGEWVYGYYVPCCFGSFPCRPAIVPEPDGKWEPLEVDPSTVGRYAGLTDKDGVNIFDGDVIRWFDWNGVVRESPVRYDPEWNRFCVWLNGAESLGVNKHLSKSIKIIGNIHDGKDGEKEAGTDVHQQDD